MNCLYCGGRIGFWGRLKDRTFCSEEHQTDYNEELRSAALDRLEETRQRAQWAGVEPEPEQEPAAERPPAHDAVQVAAPAAQPDPPAGDFLLELPAFQDQAPAAVAASMVSPVLSAKRRVAAPRTSAIGSAHPPLARGGLDAGTPAAGEWNSALVPEEVPLPAAWSAPMRVASLIEPGLAKPPSISRLNVGAAPPGPWQAVSAPESLRVTAPDLELPARECGLAHRPRLGTLERPDIAPRAWRRSIRQREARPLPVAQTPLLPERRLETIAGEQWRLCTVRQTEAPPPCEPASRILEAPAAPSFPASGPSKPRGALAVSGGGLPCLSDPRPGDAPAAQASTAESARLDFAPAFPRHTPVMPAPDTALAAAADVPARLCSAQPGERPEAQTSGPALPVAEAAAPAPPFAALLPPNTAPHAAALPGGELRQNAPPPRDIVAKGPLGELAPPAPALFVALPAPNGAPHAAGLPGGELRQNALPPRDAVARGAFAELAPVAAPGRIAVIYPASEAPVWDRRALAAERSRELPRRGNGTSPAARGAWDSAGLAPFSASEVRWPAMIDVLGAALPSRRPPFALTTNLPGIPLAAPVREPVRLGVGA